MAGIFDSIQLTDIQLLKDDRGRDFFIMDKLDWITGETTQIKYTLGEPENQRQSMADNSKSKKCARRLFPIIHQEDS